jgi:hypothetical protein
MNLPSSGGTDSAQREAHEIALVAAAAVVVVAVVGETVPSHLQKRRMERRRSMEARMWRRAQNAHALRAQPSKSKLQVWQ